MNSSLDSDTRITLEDIFQTACDLPPDKRVVYLDEACAGDDAMRREVEELIKYYETNKTFLEKPAIQDVAAQMVASGSISQSSQPMIGRQIANYRILAMIGKGGMGEVYLAHDKDLDVNVAIKFLPEAYASDPEWQARFNREGRLNSELTHQNIAALRHKGDADGRPYLVFEFVPGETLDDRLNKGTLSIKEALPIFSQLAAALAHAHSRNIIHRDLKPSNIKITPEGELKVLDFGIAKRITTDLATVDLATLAPDDQMTRDFGETRKGEVIGTVVYMSPEQTRGEMLDAGTDLWAFGCVMYEALTGRLPFKGVDTYDTLNLVRDPKHEPDWRALPSDTPKTVQKLLRQCLVKDRTRRMSSSAETHAAIEQWLNPAVKRWKRVALGATALLAIALPILLWLWASRPPQQTYLAVMPFKETAEQQGRARIGDGLTVALRDSLAAIPSLNVLPSSEVAEESAPQGEEGRQQLLKLLGVNWLLDGEVTHRGDEVEIQVNAYNSQSKQPVSAAVKGTRADYPKLRDELVSRVAAALNLKNAPRQSFVNFSKQDSEEKYLQAITYLQSDPTEENIGQPIKLLRELSESEPPSARVQAALARAYMAKMVVTENLELEAEAEKASELAVQLDASLPEVKITRGLLLHFIADYGKAIDVFKDVLQQRPNDLEALLGMAVAYDASNQTQLARQFYERAVLAWPNYWRPRSELGIFYVNRGLYGEAQAQLQYLVNVMPNSPANLINLGGLYVKTGHYQEAEKLYALSLQKEKTGYGYLGLGAAQFYQRRYGDAAETFRTGTIESSESPLLWSGLGDALRHQAGKEQEAIAAYNRAIQIREQRQREGLGAARLAELFAKRSRLQPQGAVAVSADQKKARDLIGKALAGNSSNAQPANDPEILGGAIVVYAVIGDNERAASYVAPALKAGQSLYDLENDPDLKELRQEPAYQQAVRPFKQ